MRRLSMNVEGIVAPWSCVAEPGPESAVVFFDDEGVVGLGEHPADVDDCVVERGFVFDDGEGLVLGCFIGIVAVVGHRSLVWWERCWRCREIASVGQCCLVREVG
jgi:hypothetical protein